MGHPRNCNAPRQMGLQMQSSEKRCRAEISVLGEHEAAWGMLEKGRERVYRRDSGTPTSTEQRGEGKRP